MGLKIQEKLTHTVQTLNRANHISFHITRRAESENTHIISARLHFGTSYGQL
jgi:hypothetical protein